MKRHSLAKSSTPLEQVTCPSIHSIHLSFALSKKMNSKNGKACACHWEYRLMGACAKDASRPPGYLILRTTTAFLEWLTVVVCLGKPKRTTSWN